MFDFICFLKKNMLVRHYDKEMKILYAKSMIYNKAMLLLLMLNLNLTLSNTTVSWYKRVFFSF